VAVEALTYESSEAKNSTELSSDDPIVANRTPRRRSTRVESLAALGDIGR
jgi:hypothetical protein